MVKETENRQVAKALAKSLKTSPQKANLVLKMIRGLKVEKAMNILTFSRRRISEEILKILKSAVSNAENNHQLDIDRLFVKEATVGKSMVLKRFRPRARGRSGKILKPFSRIRILVEEEEEKNVKKDIKKEQKKEENNGTKN
ncbi:MAG: 50S ribosomal protein L22 [Rickettsiales bacterium]|nr:50S ribosomal protein L22 [Rickettsiales bacterium]|tara:strand:- start:62 stop:487 length:426 start_codon:yes stop_codon:yes gene_type:complete